MLALQLCLLILLPYRFSSAVDTWCGKAYHPGDPAIDPGGRIEPPRTSPTLLLDLRIRPRVQPYLEEDVDGEFIVDTFLSHTHGQPYFPQILNKQSPANLHVLSNNTLSTNDNDVFIAIYREDTGALILPLQTIKLNTSGNQVPFSITVFKPRYEPYKILISVSTRAETWCAASTKLLRLPKRRDGGSVTKIDSLRNSLLVQTLNPNLDHLNSSVWKPLFPYSYYLGGGWIEENPSNLANFKSRGYNILHVIPGGGLGYNFTQLDEWLDEAERVGLWIMFDMRWTYQNASLVEWQVERLQKRVGLLLWYTADEPDGQVDPLPATEAAYDVIKRHDPYHPVSLCLNCENYYFKEYTSGVDIILSDVYPIGTNTSWSTKYGTVCNSTYGCCGCDNCVGSNDLTNIATRLDTFRAYQAQLGLPQKPLWAVPQAFGNQDFWKQVPTADEEVAMTMLSINHGATGIVMWTWPTSAEIAEVTSRLAKILTGIAAEYILGGEMLTGFGVVGHEWPWIKLDIVAWRVGRQMLVSIVNPSHERITGAIVLEFPPGWRAWRLVSELWGNEGWNVIGSRLLSAGLDPLSSSLLLVEVVEKRNLEAGTVNLS